MEDSKLKPATDISDRAKRYRANSVTEDWQRVCMFCGSTKDLQVDHIDGFEENGEPENLLILCRSCNQLKSSVYKKAGMGRRTVQYNPGLFSRLFGPSETPAQRARRERTERTEARERERAEDRALRKAEIEERRAERAARPVEVGRYKGFTIYKRGAGEDRVYYSTMDQDSWLDTPAQVKKLIDTFKNPAGGAQIWDHAVRVLRGEIAGSPFAAARTIRSTPVNRRYQYLDTVIRQNPEVPTFAQYAWAVSQHTRGAHDEGGAIIHATPKDARHEYADKIARIKRGRGTMRSSEVPF